MKNIILFVAVVLVFTKFPLYAQSNCDTSESKEAHIIREVLLKKNFTTYHNQKFSLLLRNETLKQFCQFINMGSYPGCVPGVILSYPQYSLRLRIYFLDKCPNEQKFKKNGKWDKRKIQRKAGIHKIEVDDLIE